MSFFTIVPHKSVAILERFNRFHTILQPGLHFFIPFIDRIAHRHSIKELMIHIRQKDQTAITKDNVHLTITGALFICINDPYKASYSVNNYEEATRLMALTIMRSEIGKMNLDTLFQERATLNERIKVGMEKSIADWGIDCLRYELLKIEPPEEIKRSMQLQAEAERLKRRDIILAESTRQSEINIAEGKKLAQILVSEAIAESIAIITEREKQSLKLLAENIGVDMSSPKFLLLSKYLENYGKMLHSANVKVIPKTGKDGGNNSDILAVAAMLMNGGVAQREPTKSRFEGELKEASESQKKVEKDQMTREKENLLRALKDLQSYDVALHSSDDESAERK